MTYLSNEQVTQLLRPIHPSRVGKRDDNGMSHLEAYDVRAHLNRIFGFGRWSADIIDLSMIFETPDTTSAGKPAFSCAYRAIVKLTVCAPDGTVLATYSEAATGDAKMPDFKRGDCHDFAIKSAESQALKRCVTNLGDQFGLSLYRKGSRDALVKRTLVMPEGGATAEDVAHDVEPVTPEAAEEAQAPSAHATSTETSAVRPPDAERTPAAPPSTSPDDLAAQQAALAAEVEKLREAALKFVAPDFKGSRQDAVVGIGKINIQAGRQHLLQHTLRRENGEEVTVTVFLDELLKRVMRKAS